MPIRSKRLLCVLVAFVVQGLVLGCLVSPFTPVPQSPSGTVLPFTPEVQSLPTTEARVTPSNATPEAHPRKEPLPTSTPAGPALVAIIVDSDTYGVLQAEIERYAQDVRRVLGTEVVVAAQSWADPQNVRAYLRGLRDEALIGAVLVGDIPATFFHARLIEAQLARVPSDFYYMELDHDLPLDGDLVFPRPAATTSLLPDIWVGRLKASRAGTEGIDQLRRYFGRNHAYRAGELSAVPQMLVLDDINAGQSQSSAEEATDVERVMGRIGLYSQQSAVLPKVMLNPRRTKEDLRQTLQTPYEFAYLNHHGTPTTQQFGQLTLTADDLLQNPSSAAVLLYLGLLQWRLHQSGLLGG